jgi:hypothetical protein
MRSTRWTALMNSVRAAIKALRAGRSSRWRPDAGGGARLAAGAAWGSG